MKKGIAMIGRIAHRMNQWGWAVCLVLGVALLVLCALGSRLGDSDHYALQRTVHLSDEPSAAYPASYYALGYQMAADPTSTASSALPTIGSSGKPLLNLLSGDARWIDWPCGCCC